MLCLSPVFWASALSPICPSDLGGSGLGLFPGTHIGKSVRAGARVPQLGCEDAGEGSGKNFQAFSPIFSPNPVFKDPP